MRPDKPSEETCIYPGQEKPLGDFGWGRDTVRCVGFLKFTLIAGWRRAWGR